MRKVFISQHMQGKTIEDINTTIDRNRERIDEAMNGEDYEIVDSIIKDAVGIKPSIWFLGKALQIMSECDTVVFLEDWRGRRGCEVEHLAATSYGFNVIELD